MIDRVFLFEKQTSPTGPFSGERQNAIASASQTNRAPKRKAHYRDYRGGGIRTLVRFRSDVEQQTTAAVMRVFGAAEGFYGDNRQSGIIPRPPWRKIRSNADTSTSH